MGATRYVREIPPDKVPLGSLLPAGKAKLSLIFYQLTTQYAKKILKQNHFLNTIVDFVFGATTGDFFGG